MSIKDINRLNNLALTGSQATKLDLDDDDEYISPLFDSVEEDVMGESIVQFNLINDFVPFLRWHYEPKGWYGVGNLTIIQSGYDDVCPDISLFLGIDRSEEDLEEVSSWKLDEPNRPAPTVVFEVASKKTWRQDLNTKPERYGQLGVREYYAYDARKKQFWAGARLRGWYYDAKGQPQPIEPNERGWLWSNELEVWIAGEPPRLRLYTAQYERVPTEREATSRLLQEGQQREADERKAREAAVRARIVAESREADERKAREEAQLREADERKAKNEAEQQASHERAILQELLEKLKKSGIDPDKL